MVPLSWSKVSPHIKFKLQNLSKKKQGHINPTSQCQNQSLNKLTNSRLDTGMSRYTSSLSLVSVLEFIPSLYTKLNFFQRTFGELNWYTAHEFWKIFEEKKKEFLDYRRSGLHLEIYRRLIFK